MKYAYYIFLILYRHHRLVITDLKPSGVIEPMRNMHVHIHGQFINSLNYSWFDECRICLFFGNYGQVERGQTQLGLCFK